MQVKCKYCETLNEKADNQYVVKCAKCGKETAYFVRPVKAK